jgi:hypothetical protein
MSDATEEMSNDHGKMLDAFYCNFEPGTLRVNHGITNPCAFHRDFKIFG